MKSPKVKAAPILPRASALATDLLRWYAHHQRHLLWRPPLGVRPDAYTVLVSELMLQQTTVATVTRHFPRFMAQFPTLASLAAAPTAAVLAAWSGLGYYRRARLLHAAAQAVVGAHGGVIPQDVITLRQLPGVGAYTAGAIAAIAYNQPALAIDGNVERVASRLLADATPPKRNLPRLSAALQSWLPTTQAGDFAQALMDLGATICTPLAPSCEVCPIAAHCRAHATGQQQQLPTRLPKKTVPTQHTIAYVLVHQDAVWLQPRPATGILASLWVPPMAPWTSELPTPATPPARAPWQAAPQPLRHIFTHLRLNVVVMSAQLTARPARLVPPALARAGQWVPLTTLGDYAVPTLTKKILRAAGLAC